MNSAYARLPQWDHQYLWHPFTQMRDWLCEEPLIIERGEGVYLIDVAGRRYVDAVSSLWCNIHGHRRRELDEALKDQADRIAHSTLLGLANIPSILLAKKLVEIAPPGLSRVFYSDAGATAVEIALKMAVQYWQLKGMTRKTQFAALAEAYHGDTLGAVSVGYSPRFHRFYTPLLFPCHRLSPPHIFRFYRGLAEEEACATAIAEARAVIEKHGGEIAALIVEPLVQGAAGMWTQPAGYLTALRELARDNAILLICDEVATGFGRTGAMFACEHEGVTPDLLCLGKGLSGGYLPLAATLATEEIFSAFLGETFFHGHTYTGNPLACAVALANLRLFEEEKTLASLPSKIAALSERLRPLADLSHVADIRQRGFMVGIELQQDPGRKIPYESGEKVGIRVAQEARARGVLIRPLGDVIVLMPPLCITQEELAFVLDAVREAIIAVTGG